MNRTFSEYLVQCLVQRAVLNWASVPGDWPTIIGSMPDNDDNSDALIAVLDTGAELDGVDHRGKKSVQHPTFQIFIRDIDYPDAFKKGKEIEANLSDVNMENVVVDFDMAVIQFVGIMIPTAFLKQQEKNQRQLFVLNIKTTMWEV